MRVFKFGGASVKDAQGVKNVLRVLQSTGTSNKVVVVSAMGKTTNALEVVIHDYLNTGDAGASLQEVKEYHHEIMTGLFEHNEAPAFTKVKDLFRELENFLRHNRSEKYDFVYDQVVCYGELISTTIVSEYLLEQGIKNEWMDARSLVKTDSTYRTPRWNGRRPRNSSQNT